MCFLVTIIPITLVACTEGLTADIDQHALEGNYQVGVMVFAKPSPWDEECAHPEERLAYATGGTLLTDTLVVTTAHQLRSLDPESPVYVWNDPQTMIAALPEHATCQNPRQFADMPDVSTISQRWLNTAPQHYLKDDDIALIEIKEPEKLHKKKLAIPEPASQYQAMDLQQFDDIFLVGTGIDYNASAGHMRSPKSTSIKEKNATIGRSSHRSYAFNKVDMKKPEDTVVSAWKHTLESQKIAVREDLFHILATNKKNHGDLIASGDSGYPVIGRKQGRYFLIGVQSWTAMTSVTQTSQSKHRGSPKRTAMQLNGSYRINTAAACRLYAQALGERSWPPGLSELCDGDYFASGGGPEGV